MARTFYRMVDVQLVVDEVQYEAASSSDGVRNLYPAGITLRDEHGRFFLKIKGTGIHHEFQIADLATKKFKLTLEEV